MKKFKYLLGRLKRMNFKKMFNTINEIHNKTNKSKIYLLIIISFTFPLIFNSSFYY